MEKRWGRRAQSLSDEMIWLLAQVAGALLVVILLYTYIDAAIAGGTLAKQFYPAHFSLLATVTGSAHDAMIMGDFVEKFGKTEFNVASSQDEIVVSSPQLKGERRHWLLLPQGITVKPMTVAPATGALHVALEGNALTLRKEASWTPLLPCAAGKSATQLTATHVIEVVPDKRTVNDKVITDLLLDVARRIQARVPSLLIVAEGTPQTIARDEALRKRTGIQLVLRSDETSDDVTRVVAYYNPAAPAAVQRESQRLGCHVLNALLASDLSKNIGGVAVVPSSSTRLVQDAPGIDLVVVQPGAKSHVVTDAGALQKVIVDGLGAYHG